MLYVRGLNLKCVDCHELFSIHADYRNHMLLEHGVSRPYGCPGIGCTKQFGARSSLMKHVERAHTDKEKEYECGVCHKRFHHKRKKEIHCRIHRNRREFECEHC